MGTLTREALAKMLTKKFFNTKMIWLFGKNFKTKVTNKITSKNK